MAETTKKVARPWTDAHRREALRRTYEIAAEACEKRPSADIRNGLAAMSYDVEAGEDRWRAALAQWLQIDPARIDREVRRVRALAEGRLVRETDTRYVVARSDGERPASFMASIGANDYARSPERPKAHTYKVIRATTTRIRRA